MSGWHDKAPPGPASAVLLVLAVLVGVGMVWLGVRRRRPVLARGLMVAAFTDEEPGPKIRWEGR